MKVAATCKKGLLKLLFTLQEGDNSLTGHKSLIQKERKKIRMGSRQCEVSLPRDLSLDTIHPDVLALSVMLMVYPFTHKSIELPIGVSNTFAEDVALRTSKEVHPVDSSLQPRKNSKSQLPALAFSGGIDSTAALMLMPSNTVLVFLDRILRKTLYNSYNPAAARHACDYLSHHGRSVYKIRTDLEYLKAPVPGYPVDVANAVPLLLLSDYLGLNGVGFGMIMESAYMIGHLRFENYPDRIHYKRWGKLFEIVGMPFILTTAGLSEVATSSLVLRSQYRDLAQSCVRGNIGKPCMDCYKCFRKQALDSVLRGESLDDSYLSALFNNRGARTELQESPIHHGNVLGYITARYHGNHPLMNLLKKRVRGDILDFSWLEKWYGPSRVLIPQTYRDYITAKICANFQVMSEQEEEIVRGWDVKDMEESVEILQYCQNLAQELSKIQHKTSKQGKLLDKVLGT
jgi:hypothetical protein